MNYVHVSGRLTKQPEIRATATGKKTASFTVAVDRSFKNAEGKREADFFPVVFWGNIADTLEKYLTKGSRVIVTGRLQTRSYDDKDGVKRYVTEIVGENIDFLDSAKAAEAAPEAAEQ